LPKERKTKQIVFVDISCKYKYDNRTKEYINYADISEDVSKIIKEKKFELLEECLIYLKSYITKKYKIKKSSLKITIKKPQAIKNAIASVGF